MSLRAEIKAEEVRDIVALVENFGGAIKGDDIRLVMGRALQERIKAHFYELEGDAGHHRTADRLGASRTGFYLRAGDQTHAPQIVPEGVSVTVNQLGLRQRLYGGPIEPLNAKYLTIPARAEAYGKRAAEFDNLRVILFPGGRGALVERDATISRGPRKGEPIGGDVYFWLVKSVTQKPDPSVLPTEEEVLDPVLENARNYIERVWKESPKS